MNTECISNTIHFIESNYNKPISIRDLERLSFYSYRNIQRIFKYACGETIGAFQKRLKLENAYKLLLYTNDSLTKIALDIGFENNSSFSKAFRQLFGISPIEARKNKTELFFKHKLVPQISEKKVNPEIIYIPAVKVCYQSIRTDYANKEIENLWDNLMTQSQPSLQSAYYGIIADESLITDKIKCRYYACISHPVITHSLSVKTVFGRKYAKFMHSGSYNNIEDTYALIYSNWILSTQLQFSSSPIIEHYIKHDTNTANEKDYVTAILIPLHA